MYLVQDVLFPLALSLAAGLFLLLAGLATSDREKRRLRRMVRERRRSSGSGRRRRRRGSGTQRGSRATEKGPNSSPSAPDRSRRENATGKVSSGASQGSTGGERSEEDIEREAVRIEKEVTDAPDILERKAHGDLTGLVAKTAKEAVEAHLQSIDDFEGLCIVEGALRVSGKFNELNEADLSNDISGGVDPEDFGGIGDLSHPAQAASQYLETAEEAIEESMEMAEKGNLDDSLSHNIQVVGGWLEGAETSSSDVLGKSTQLFEDMKALYIAEGNRNLGKLERAVEAAELYFIMMIAVLLKEAARLEYRRSQTGRELASGSGDVSWSQLKQLLEREKQHLPRPSDDSLDRFVEGLPDSLETVRNKAYDDAFQVYLESVVAWALIITARKFERGEWSREQAGEMIEVSKRFDRIVEELINNEKLLSDALTAWNGLEDAREVFQRSPDESPRVSSSMGDLPSGVNKIIAEPAEKLEENLREADGEKSRYWDLMLNLYRQAVYEIQTHDDLKKRLGTNVY